MSLNFDPLKEVARLHRLREVLHQNQFEFRAPSKTSTIKIEDDSFRSSPKLHIRKSPNMQIILEKHHLHSGSNTSSNCSTDFKMFQIIDTPKMDTPKEGLKTKTLELDFQKTQKIRPPRKKNVPVGGGNLTKKYEKQMMTPKSNVVSKINLGIKQEIEQEKKPQSRRSSSSEDSMLLEFTQTMQERENNAINQYQKSFPKVQVPSLMKQKKRSVIRLVPSQQYIDSNVTIRLNNSGTPDLFSPVTEEVKVLSSVDKLPEVKNRISKDLVIDTSPEMFQQSPLELASKFEKDISQLKSAVRKKNAQNEILFSPVNFKSYSNLDNFRSQEFILPKISQLNIENQIEKSVMKGSILKSYKKPIKQRNISPAPLPAKKITSIDITEPEHKFMGKNISMPVITPKRVQKSFDRFKLYQSKNDERVADESQIGSVRQSLDPMSPKYKVGSNIIEFPESRQSLCSPFLGHIQSEQLLEVSSCNPKSTINDEIIQKNIIEENIQNNRASMGQISVAVTSNVVNSRYLLNTTPLRQEPDLPPPVRTIIHDYLHLKKQKIKKNMSVLQMAHRDKLKELQKLKQQNNKFKIQKSVLFAEKQVQEEMAEQFKRTPVLSRKQTTKTDTMKLKTSGDEHNIFMHFKLVSDKQQYNLDMASTTQRYSPSIQTGGFDTPLQNSFIL